MRNRNYAHAYFLLVYLLLLALPITAETSKAKVSVRPYAMTCENLDNPLGLDVPKPRFSWKLASVDKSKYGQKQMAYRILVSQSKESLDKGIGYMWDSEWVYSPQTHLVEYAGNRLSSDRKYWWKVVVKDEKGQMSDESEVAYWTTGLFSKFDWYSDWIGAKEEFDFQQPDCNIFDPWLRKKIEIDTKPLQAIFFVASVGFHELYVNGEKISDYVMAPAATDYSKHVRYVAYDIAHHLNKGQNTIALWLGTSWSIFPPYATEDKPKAPIVKAQCSVYDLNNQVIERIETDATWKTHPSPNKLLGKWVPKSMGGFGGEIWDANKEIENWNKNELNDSDWKQATVYYPNLKLTAQKVEQNRLFEEIKPIEIKELPNGDYRVDMGVNFAGWTEVKMSGSPGSRVDFLFSEREQDEITFDLRNAYIFDQTGNGVFKNRFNYSSGRWITIKGLKNKPRIEDIRGWLVRTSYKTASTFESSSRLQNWMYDRILWTFNNLSVGGMIVDCPQRERMGYGGDAHATSETGMMNFKMGAFYTKWMEDWRDVQGVEPLTGNMYNPNVFRKKEGAGRILNNGILPHTAPTYWGGGGPPWGGICVSIPWLLYSNDGDTRIIEDNIELIKGWLAFLDSHVENDLLKPYGTKWDFLGDWLWPNATQEGMNTYSPQNSCYNNCFRVYNLRTASKLARIIGRIDEAEIWEKQADRSAKAINEKYFNASDYSYADGSMSSLVAALIAEVPSDELRMKVFERLENEILQVKKGHIHVGITAGGLLFKLLREMRRDDLLYAMTSKTSYPSWGYMKENGATSIWEMWEKDLKGHSLLHSSFLYPGAWYIEGLSGIRKKKGSVGYRDFDIMIPNIEDPELSWVKSSYDSPHGLIEVFWERDKTNRLKLNLTVPPNCEATVYLPDTAKIYKNSKFAADCPSQNGFAVFRLVAGNYKFENYVD